MARKIDELKPLGAAITLGVMLFLTAIWPVVEARAGDAPSDEYQMKAAYLLNFAQYIEWPAGAFPDSSSPLIVGVLGDDPFGDALDQTFQDETIQGHKVIIKRSHRVQDLKDSELLFVSTSEKDHIADILASLGDASIVTVSETDGFAERGGIINFYLDGKKIRFEINPDAAQHKGLKISSQLLKRARIVSSDEDKGK